MNIFKRFYWVIGATFCTILWFIASHFNWLDKSLLASPSETFSVLFSDKNNMEITLWQHTTATLSNTLIGWIYVVITGGVTGYFFARNKLVSSSFKAIFEFFRAIPPILVFPLMYIAFDQQPMSYIGTIIFGCFPIMFLTVLGRFKKKKEIAYEILKVSSVSKRKLIFVTIFDNIPSLVLAARLSFSFALIIAVVTEMINTPDPSHGLGALAKDSMNSFETPTYYAVLVILGIIGVVGNSILYLLEKRAYSIYLMPSRLNRIFQKPSTK